MQGDERLANICRQMVQALMSSHEGVADAITAI
jgi:hypothetical protein